MQEHSAEYLAWQRSEQACAALTRRVFSKIGQWQSGAFPTPQEFGELTAARAQASQLLDAFMRASATKARSHG